jgi:aryl-alcohol dehydrogenase-like predicted oxidoreductase
MQTLLLGTAQWGLDYGVTNLRGRLPDEELLQLVEVAQSVGIDQLDTAPAYGDSEARIGALSRDFRLQTKVSALGLSEKEVVKSIDSSLRILGQDSLWSVLIHDWAMLEPRQRIRALKVLSDLQTAGTIERFGISVYEEADLDELVEAVAIINVIQLPVNALDQRLVNSDVLVALRNRGVSIQARSIFLQGVMLDVNHAASHSNHPHVRRFHEHCDSWSMTPTAAGVNFIKSLEWVDEVVVGVANAAQLQEFARAWEADGIKADWVALASEDIDLLDPRRWAGASS